MLFPLFTRVHFQLIAELKVTAAMVTSVSSSWWRGHLPEKSVRPWGWRCRSQFSGNFGKWHQKILNIVASCNTRVRYLKERANILTKAMKLDSFKPLLSGHYILNPVACLLYVILRCVQPFCGWLFPGEECSLNWVSKPSSSVYR